jgi:hydrogenase maturation factor
MLKNKYISLAHGNGVRLMRDPTRGGLATVMHELVCTIDFGINLYQKNT